MIALGVDPGLSGAFAWFDGEEAFCIPVPSVKVKGRGSMIVIPQLVSEFDLMGFAAAGHAFVEQVGSQPGEGVSSAFKFGRTLGIMEGIVASFRVPMTRVTPQVWKRYAGLIGAPKSASVLRASELMPRSVQQWTSKRNVITKKQCEGTAEAALIAHYGHHKLSGKP